MTTLERLTEGPNVLSWDCGISNLCYCLVEVVPGTGGSGTYRIALWENLSLNSQTLKQATEQLVLELDSRPWMIRADAICIESQVLKNVQMKVVSHVIQCYFETRGIIRKRQTATTQALARGISVCRSPYVPPSVHFVMAESKFKAVPKVAIPEGIEALNRRSRNKKASVFLAHELLARQGQTEALEFLAGFQKKDDLCDSFLQGVYFLKQRAQRVRNAESVRSYLGLGPLPPGGREPGTEISIDVEGVTGTEREPGDPDDTLNEGCEYNHEVPLPQLYIRPGFSCSSGRRPVLTGDIYLSGGQKNLSAGHRLEVSSSSSESTSSANEEN